MTSEEDSIWLFLSESSESAFSRREIARRAVKRAVFEDNPRWGDDALNSLVARNVIEITDDGHYRIKGRRSD